MIFTGCSSKGLQDNPGKTEQVISNGGLTVVKGDYLYYVNGFVDRTTLDVKTDNKFGKVEKGAIYRTKLSDSSEISKDDEGFLEKTECVAPKVVGFDNGGFYIIDDYIYYATPNMNLSSDGTPQTDRVEFHKIKIDGTDDKLIYSTEKAQENLDWTVYKVDDKVYILTYCDSKIISVDTERKETVAVIENSTSYAFYDEPNYSTNNTRNDEHLRYVYYTRNATDGDNFSANRKGNLICKFDVSKGEEIVLDAELNCTYSIKQIIKSGVECYIYYTKVNSEFNGLALLYKSNITNGWNLNNEIKMTNKVYTNYYICDFGNDLMIVSDGSATYRVSKNGAGNIVATKIFTSSQTILGVFGGYAYYNSDGILRRFYVYSDDITDGVVTTTYACDDTYTSMLTNSNYIDFDNQRIYIFAEYTAENTSLNYYLNYITFDGEEVEQRFVGMFEKDHLPKAPEEEKDENGEVINIPHVN
jgi:hypothetical protein